MEQEILNKLREIFTEHDLMNIYFGRDENFDEYDQEIELILKEFPKCKNPKEFRKKMHEVFQRKFSKELAGEEEKYNQIAKEVYEVLKHSKK